MKFAMKQAIRPVYMFYPGLYPLLMLNYWIRRSDIPIVGIIISDFDLKHQGKILSFFEVIVGVGQYSGWRYLLYMLFTAKFAVPVVSLWNGLRKMFGREVKIKTYTEIAKERGIPIYRSKNFNSPECHAFIRNVNANLIVSAYNNQILKPETYKLPEFGAINVHHALLPNFRGLDGPFQALRCGVPFGGSTIHRVESKIDTGKIIAQSRVRIRRDDTVFSLSVRSWMHGAKLLGDVLKQFEAGNVREVKQSNRDIMYSYASFPAKAEVKELRRKGRRIVRLRDFLNTMKD